MYSKWWSERVSGVGVGVCLECGSMQQHAANPTNGIAKKNMRPHAAECSNIRHRCMMAVAVVAEAEGGRKKEQIQRQLLALWGVGLGMD